MNPEFTEEPESQVKVPLWKQFMRAVMFLLFHVLEQILYAVSRMWQNLIPSGLVWATLYLSNIHIDWLIVLIGLTAIQMSYKTIEK